MRIDALEGCLGPNVAIATPIQYLEDCADRLELATSSDSPESRSLKLLAKASRYNIHSTHRLKAMPQSALFSINGMADFHAIIKQLQLGQNKLMILRLLRRSDWIKILHLLPKYMLVNALRLFSKQKLLRMVMHLDKRLRLKLILGIYNIPELIRKMPTTELMRILRSRKLNNLELAKGIMKMEPQFILLMLRRLYGDHDYSRLKPYELFKIFMQTSKARLMEVFKTMPFKALQPMVTDFVKQDPELLLRVSELFVFRLLDKITKPTLIQGCAALPPEVLILMLCQLPDAMLMLAAAQLDDISMENFLISDHSDLLLMLSGAA